MVEPYLAQVHSHFDIFLGQSSSYIHTIQEQTGRIEVHLDSNLHTRYQQFVQVEHLNVWCKP